MAANIHVSIFLRIASYLVFKKRIAFVGGRQTDLNACFHASRYFENKYLKFRICVFETCSTLVTYRCSRQSGRENFDHLLQSNTINTNVKLTLAWNGKLYNSCKDLIRICNKCRIRCTSKIVIILT